MSKESILSVKEIFEKTIELIKSILNGETIVLPSRVLAEIANDSDWHRTRVGYSKYESFVLVTIGKNKWAIALGEKCGQYSAAPYNCDIAVVKIVGGDLIKVVQDGLGAEYFENAILFAMANGTLRYISGSDMAEKLFKIFQQESIARFVGQEMESNLEFIDPCTLNYLVTKEIKYKESFVLFLTTNIITILGKE